MKDGEDTKSIAVNMIDSEMRGVMWVGVKDSKTQHEKLYDLIYRLKYGNGVPEYCKSTLFI